ncbi:hypothetical protein COV23_00765 [Candidatus Wolfebacteria bacterium CG10_big_fil_rev_8_21_14_0_10_31_9]|uniref:Aminoacyl-tRNA hydrolase n=1 Tax=Candidatus Wolfebacteria bacterium CG10_big_fil_rev_8_21_14_0_10_31_9 TaxID=1975070 RepID=A0A2H0RCK4_9BACT|nr:MAG: hypothetical protein COV23_00765 [Candidatus Wolfebacteria bacterium CG10_big_fil_rev_8_21_14_0_10_31_9]
MLKKPQFKIIFGLGNPGEEYEKTYHNVGFLFVSFLLKNPEYLVADKIKLVEQIKTFMNVSGPAVLKEIKKRKLKTGEVLIAHDDADIEIGKYKIDFNRGSAGHHGVESIIKSLGTKNFWRLRIGIAPVIQIDTNINTNTHKSLKRKKAIEYVLKKISKKDMGKLEQVFNQIAQELS